MCLFCQMQCQHKSLTHQPKQSINFLNEEIQFKMMHATNCIAVFFELVTAFLEHSSIIHSMQFIVPIGPLDKISQISCFFGLVSQQQTMAFSIEKCLFIWAWFLLLLLFLNHGHEGWIDQWCHSLVWLGCCLSLPLCCLERLEKCHINFTFVGAVLNDFSKMM